MRIDLVDNRAAHAIKISMNVLRSDVKQTFQSTIDGILPEPPEIELDIVEVDSVFCQHILSTTH